MPAKWLHRFERKPGRWVFEPSPEARAEGTEVKVLVESRWNAPRYYFHLRPGGHVAALQRHQRNASFIKVDIADFFGSVSRSRISRVLKEFFSHTDARRMATASTVQHPDDDGRQILPYGFIQSPLLASLALHKSALGKYLDELHREKRLVVTVYVDDLIVSGDDHDALGHVLAELKLRARRSRFALSDEKEQGPAASISAFNIELTSGVPLSILPPKLAEFRDVFRASTNELQRAGIQGYVRSVNETQAGSLP
ncbi:MAG: reverse transcriptase domain-containing protein [Burkholderiaceae bacterium]|nr:reverse transcriptase domain-containing protein [Burkholderiaceae bacterium]